MGYYGNLEAKLKAQAMRKKGLSYKEIQMVIPVPKSTLSGWCRDVILTEQQARRLFSKKLKGSALGRIIGAKRVQAKRLHQIQEMLEKGKKDIGRLSKRDTFVIGVALYAAEGTKKSKEIAFANSDPLMIIFMMRWFRTFCHVSEEKFRGAIWLHEGLDEKKAKQFWSDLTNIPAHQFYKTYIAEDKKHSKKIRKQKHPFGVFSIKVSDAKKLRLINGWIAGILGDPMV